MRDLAGFLVAFSVLAVAFTLVERRFAALPGQRLFRRAGARTDLVYWVAQPLVFRPLARGFTVVAVVLFALAAGVRADKAALAEWVRHGHGPLAGLPAGIQAVLALVIGDLVGYVVHRFFHRGRLWRFHAVHHSATELSWLSAVRAHPVNEITNHALHALVLVGLGFRLGVLAGVLPFFALYGLLLHANVRWTFGPLRYVLASPTFHRWHHTSQAEGLDKNFAGLFPVWDLMFGTFYMPPERLPTRFGVAGDPVPQTFWRQLVWPFRRPG